VTSRQATPRLTWRLWSNHEVRQLVRAPTRTTCRCRGFLQLLDAASRASGLWQFMHTLTGGMPARGLCSTRSGSTCSRSSGRRRAACANTGSAAPACSLVEAGHRLPSLATAANRKAEQTDCEHETPPGARRGRFIVFASLGAITGDGAAVCVSYLRATAAGRPLATRRNLRIDKRFCRRRRRTRRAGARNVGRKGLRVQPLCNKPDLGQFPRKRLRKQQLA
jgi:hypothetical protein